MACKHYIITLCFLLGLCSILGAQTPNLNQTDEKGNRVGYWINKGADGKLLSKGRYNEQGKKEGEWRFYMSPIGRYTGTPDVIGTYENGVKHGKWEFTDSKTKNMMKGKFIMDKMDGVWIVYSSDGQKSAAGRYVNGIREGEWMLFINGNNIMARGYYEDGVKVGNWLYDYYLENGAVHIKGNFNYQKGERRGLVEYYKVERHPKFGVEELLVGTGTFLNDMKAGRWIEYSKGLKGELIETGYYDGEGRKTGQWSAMLNGRSYIEESFNDGKRQGSFKTYYDNGQLKYDTSFDDGYEIGFYTSYYESGQVKEKGAHTILQNEVVSDTTYYKVELPYEYHFKLIDLDYEQLNYNAIDWIDQADVSLPSAEAEKRWKEFLTYGKTNKLRVKEITKRSKQSVRVGNYVSYFSNGKTQFEGKYYPKIMTAYSPINKRMERDFAKDGEWKEYDPVGYLKLTYFFEQGILKRVEDDKGREVDILNNSAGG